tara:strand:+ start:128 stop:523 length:396 start_codon:yes stop_codon:yes gene_type:complete
MSSKSKIKMGSNRNFGLVFFFVFIVISLWPFVLGGHIRIWAMLIATAFLILGLLNSSLLTPLNKIWFKFGIFLGIIIAPVVMGFVFFFVVTPVGLMMRIIGKDLLRKKYDKKIRSYWIDREKYVGTMKRQF